MVCAGAVIRDVASVRGRSIIQLADRITRKLKTLTTRPVSATWPTGVISFTFDDFPKSALSAGATILESHGARGTYYTAFGLAKTHGAPGEMFDLDDVREAFSRGHEIACHTHTHINCATAKPAQLESEIRANAAAAAAALGGIPLINFSYPFGGISRRAKTAIRPFFASCRGIEPGINEGVPDYAELRANRIYTSLFDEARLRALVDRNRAVGGWLIFYTHDVGDAPSAYGCTGAELDSVVSYAASHSPVLPVREVVSAMGAARAP